MPRGHLTGGGGEGGHVGGQQGQHKTGLGVVYLHNTYTRIGHTLCPPQAGMELVQTNDSTVADVYLQALCEQRYGVQSRVTSVLGLCSVWSWSGVDGSIRCRLPGGD